MIDYGSFLFACPPRTGTTWFVKACQLVGLGVGFTDKAHTPFCCKKDCNIKISLVRHPCNWITSCYSAVVNKDPCYLFLGPFTCLDTTSLNSFVRDYLNKFPGYISILFSKYKADTYMRLEDMPWAFIEFAESLGSGLYNIDLCRNLKKQNVTETLYFMKPEYRDKLRESDRLLYDTYDYY